MSATRSIVRKRKRRRPVVIQVESPPPAPPRFELTTNLGLALLLFGIVGGWLYWLLPTDPTQRLGVQLFAVITVALALLALTRPPARQRDGRWWVYLICLGSIVYPLAYLFDRQGRWMGVIFWGRMTLQLVANLFLLSLGRSYAMLPALRQVRTRLGYRFVRHPVYAMYILADSCAVCLQPTLWNFAVAAVGITLFYLRARLEEQVLRHDAAYAEYMTRVPWRFFPGVY